MRNVVTGILLLFFVLQGRSQSSVYHFFPDSGFAWIEEFTDTPGAFCCCVSSQCTNFYSYTHYLGSDTVENNMHYQRLFESGFVIRTNLGTVTCPPNSYSPCYQYFYQFDCAWLREDSAARKIYIRMPGDTMDELLYDFNMLVGDTVRGSIGGGINYVSAIDSVQVGTDFHKRYWVTMFGGNQPGYDSAYATITEGLGGSQGVMMTLMPVDSSFGNMICAYDQSVPVWPANQSGCLMPTGTERFEQHPAFAVFPNPAHDRIEVYTTGESGTITISDMQARAVCSVDVRQAKTEITLSHLPAGFYTINIYTSSGHTATQKLVIR